MNQTTRDQRRKNKHKSLGGWMCGYDAFSIADATKAEESDMLLSFPPLFTQEFQNKAKSGIVFGIEPDSGFEDTRQKSNRYEDVYAYSMLYTFDLMVKG
jgi:hypothetical protein